MMAEDWMAFKSDAERDIMIKQARAARLMMTVGYIFAILGTFGLNLPPYLGIQISRVENFTDQEKRLPLQTYHFYDTDKSPLFELTFLIHIVTIFLAAIVYISTGILLVLIIFHICGQLENFRYRIIRLVLCKNFNRALNDIITRHLRLIRFADNIENIYSLMTLLSLFHSCIVYCLSSFLCIIVLSNRKKDRDLAQVLLPGMIIAVVLTDTYLYCGAGELVTEKITLGHRYILTCVFVKCNAIYRTICDLEWYKLEPKQAKNLILLMMRANHSFHITAGKVIPLTMATFCSILKTSTGYISVLMTMHG